jgi:hypothetical protein
MTFEIWRDIAAFGGALLGVLHSVRALLEPRPIVALGAIKGSLGPSLRLTISNPSRFPVTLCDVRVYDSLLRRVPTSTSVEGWGVRDVIRSTINQDLNQHLPENGKCSVDFDIKSVHRTVVIVVIFKRHRFLILPLFPRFILRSSKALSKLKESPVLALANADPSS